MKKLNFFCLLVCLIFCLCSVSQPTANTINQGSKKLSANFSGQIEYSDFYIKAILARDSCGSVLVFQMWSFKNSYATIETFNPNDSISSTSIPLKFFMKKNSIYLTCIDDKSNSDSIEQFRINRSDTLISFDDFRLSASYKKTQEEIESTYIGDTILNIENIKYDCYRFELFKYWMKTNPGPSHFKKIIYFDKQSLIPVQEDFLSYYMSHFCIPTEQWILMRQIRIKKIQ